MPQLITAALAARVADTGAATVSEIVFIPEGSHGIRPQTQKKGITIHVPPERGPAIAAALQADLDERLKSNVPPWFDFEHSRKAPKSGYPKSFRYEPGKGVMCSVEWSESGLAAIRGRDVNHFSPEFYVAEDGSPAGLPMRGPIGGLVSEPAFRSLQAIAASADLDERSMQDDPQAYEDYLDSLRIAAGEDLDRPTRAAALTEELHELAGQKVAAGEASTFEEALTIACAERDGDYRAAFMETAPPQDSRVLLQAAQDLDAELQRIVAAGEASSEDEALELLCHRSPDLYSTYLTTLAK